MSNKRIAIGIILAFVCCLSLTASAQIGVRVLLGVTDEASVNWDGSVTADGARVTRLDPWRFGKDDELNPDNSWKNLYSSRSVIHASCIQIDAAGGRERRHRLAQRRQSQCHGQCEDQAGKLRVPPERSALRQIPVRTRWTSGDRPRPRKLAVNEYTGRRGLSRGGGWAERRNLAGVLAISPQPGP